MPRPAERLRLLKRRAPRGTDPGRASTEAPAPPAPRGAGPTLPGQGPGEHGGRRNAPVVCEVTPGPTGSRRNAAGRAAGVSPSPFNRPRATTPHPPFHR